MPEWEKAAEAEEILVPIRILVDQDGVKYKDDFTWNFNGERPFSIFSPIHFHFLVPHSSSCLRDHRNLAYSG